MTPARAAAGPKYHLRYPMPVMCEVDHSVRRITYTAAGNVSLSEWLDALEWQVAGGIWGYTVLVDLRGLVGVPTERDVGGVIERLRRMMEHDPKRTAVAAVTSSPAVYGMARMFGMRADDLAFAYRIFTDKPAAERWLLEQANEIAERRS